MPSHNTCGLTWVSLTLEWGVSSRLLQQSAAAAPYLGRGVSSYSLPDLERGVAPLSHACARSIAAAVVVCGPSQQNYYKRELLFSFYRWRN